MTASKINKNYLVVLLGILAALGPFTIDMYLPAFPRIAENFYTDDNHVAFTLTSYFIGIALGQLLYGPIIDKYGRKKPLLFGLSLYIVAALGCALSVNIEMMIGMRFLQALGGCVGMVASTAIVSDVFEVEKRASALSMIILVMGVAPLIAPSVGSFFITHGDWYVIFYFLASFALFVGILIRIFLPETNPYMHQNKLQMRVIAKDYLEVLKNKMFLGYTIAASLAMSIMFAYISSASFVFMTYYKLDASTFSILFAINASGIISGSIINGAVTKRFNYIKVAKVASIALCIIALSILSAVYFIEGLNYKWLVASLFSILFCIGFIMPNATTASLAPFTKNAGTASALSGAIRMGFGALVAAMIGLFQGETPVTLYCVILILAVCAMILMQMKFKSES